MASLFNIGDLFFCDQGIAEARLGLEVKYLRSKVIAIIRDYLNLRILLLTVLDFHFLFRILQMHFLIIAESESMDLIEILFLACASCRVSRIFVF